MYELPPLFRPNAPIRKHTQRGIGMKKGTKMSDDAQGTR